MNTIARVKELADERNLTLSDIASICKVPYNTLKSAEKRGSQLAVDTIELICAGLQLTLADFFTEKEAG